MIDIQHDSPTPIHEQITSQIMAHVASGDLPAGATLADYREFAQQLLTNPQVVARAYADLEWAGVLRKHPVGGMEVIAGADVVCKVRLQDMARQRLREAVRHARAIGLSDVEIHQAIDQETSTPPPPPLTRDELRAAIKKPSHAASPQTGAPLTGTGTPQAGPPHATSHRDSQGIQDLSRQKGPRPA
jgi:GntR family transcriptional regulator